MDTNSSKIINDIPMSQKNMCLVTEFFFYDGICNNNFLFVTKSQLRFHFVSLTETTDFHSHNLCKKKVDIFRIKFFLDIWQLCFCSKWRTHCLGHSGMFNFLTINNKKYYLYFFDFQWWRSYRIWQLRNPFRLDWTVIDNEAFVWENLFNIFQCINFA